MKPLIFITGFLGAGKTTLLRTLSTRLGDRDVNVDAILNDYINAAMEAATINESAVSVVPLESGCACCESLDELVAVCRAALNGKGDLLLLELNGTADPLPVMEAFSILHETLPFFPRLQVCLIDARLWGKRGDLIPLEKRQLETAGYWMLSHADKVDPTRIAEVEQSVRMIAPHSSRVTVRDFENIVIAELNTPGKHATNSHRKWNTESDIVDHRHDSVHRMSHRFTGCCLPLPSKVRRHSIEQLITELPSRVLRAKALVKMVEHPGSRWLFQRTGSEPLQPPLAVPGVCNIPASLICIGPGLDEEKLKSLIQYHFGAI